MNDSNTGVDPRALMLYMRDLGVEFIYENDYESTMLDMTDKMALIAKKKGFNVLALGNTLDKLADEFLSSIFYKGKIQMVGPCVKNR